MKPNLYEFFSSRNAFAVVFFLLCLSPLILIGSIDQNINYSKGAVPSWVKSYDFPLEPVAIKPSQVNLQYLLIDSQRNWEEKIFYRHFVVKALTQNGIEKISQLKIDFDPSYCQVIMHAIRIFRGGEWLDRLENSRHHLIQRETELEQNLYNGDLTLVYFLDDIREGDILEYSYSFVGENPIFSSHYTDWAYLQREFSVEKITHRFLANPDLSFLIKPVNIEIEPQIKNLTPSLREWTWEAVDTPLYSSEPDQPIWYSLLAHIEMSQYRTWGDVAQKLLPIFKLPEGFAQSIPSEMNDLIIKWKEVAKDSSDRALLALRFVQDEVRYQGIEEGMGAFQPTDPRLVFQRRFGDCKDKTFLLHALLQLLEIPSTPLLVHSSRGKQLPDVLPNPRLFNHLVLQLEIDGEIYYVDPTLSLQGGTLLTNPFPDYYWGLLLSNKSENLTLLPELILKYPTEIDTTFVLESEDSASLKIKSVFYDSKADRVRRSVKWDGLERMTEEGLSYLQEVYGKCAIDAPIEVSDDRESNRLTLIESYRLSTQKLSDKKALEVFSFTLRSYLHDRINPERSSPYELTYPLWVKEHIRVENPLYQWKTFAEENKREHESLFFILSTRIHKNSADFNFELRHLQDHVPKDSLHAYWQIVKAINREGPGRMTIASFPSTKKNVDSYALFFIGCIVWPVLYAFSREKRLTQDFLSFYLIRFRIFYFAIVVLSVVCTGHYFQKLPFIGLYLFCINIYSINIILKRSVKLVLFLQGIVALTALFICSLLFIKKDIHLPEILAFITCCLYLIPCFIEIKKIKVFLLQEKKLYESAK